MRIAFERIVSVILLVLSSSGCVRGPQVHMNPDLPIDTAHGYRQNGEKLDEKHMIAVLGRKPASAGRVRLARALGNLGNVFAAAGGGLAGWEAGERAVGGDMNPKILYAAGGIVGAAVVLAVASVLSIQGAVRAHNRAVGFREGSEDVPPPLPSPRSAAPSVAEPSIAEQGSLLSAQARLGDLTINWLGDVDPAHPRLALRLQRPAAPAMLEHCEFLDVHADQRLQRLPVVHGSQSADGRVIERVQAVIDLEGMQSIVDAKTVELRVCNIARTLSLEAVSEGRLLLETYRARLAEARASTAPVAEAAAPDGVLEVATPVGSVQPATADTSSP
jgi:hypothetical protein